MASSVTATLTNGIQDISALLPLLGTDQCAAHVLSALDNGFLYAAATPLSIFGSLGVVKAGFNVLLASINIPRLGFVGTTWLKNAGFALDGSTADRDKMVALLAMDGRQFVAETQVDAKLRELNIDDMDRLELKYNCLRWNVRLALSCATSALLALVPYVPLMVIPQYKPSDGPSWNVWAFPVMRAVGTSLTAGMIQFILQLRISEIIRKRLVLKKLQKRNGLTHALKKVDFSLSAEQCVESVRNALEPQLLEGHPKRSRGMLHSFCIPCVDLEASFATTTSNAPGGPSKIPATLHQNVHHMLNKEFPTEQSLSWGLLLLLLLQAMIVVGLVMSIVGYVGCFSVVQASASNGPIIWLAVEIALSIIRIIVWAHNPGWDDATDIRFTLKLFEKPPMITCSHRKEDLKLKTLPLLRAEEFLKDITRYAGFIEPFNHEKITLYYALSGSSDAKEKILYVTIFDHSERATYTLVIDSWNAILSPQDDILNTLYYATLEVDSKSNAPKVQLHDLVNSRRNPIASFTEKLKVHCISILSGITDVDKVPPLHSIQLYSWSLGVHARVVESRRLSVERIMTGTSTAYSESWPRITDSDRLYLELGESQRLLTIYVRKRGSWIEESVKVLQLNSTFAANNMRERMPQSAVSDILLDWEAEFLTLMDLKEYEAMETIVVHEAHALMLTSLVFLVLMLSDGRLEEYERVRLGDEWFQTAYARWQAERTTSLARLRTQQSRDLDLNRTRFSIKKESRAAIEALWDHIRPDRAHLDRDSIFHVGGYLSSFKLELPRSFDLCRRNLKQNLDDIIGGVYIEDNAQFHSSRVNIVYEKLLERYRVTRALMEKRLDAEVSDAQFRWFKLFDLVITTLSEVTDIGASDLDHHHHHPQSSSNGDYTETEPPQSMALQLAVEGHLQLQEVLDPYIQADLPALAEMVFNNRKHYALALGSDMEPQLQLPIDECCDMLARNQTAAVVILGSVAESYWKNDSSMMSMLKRRQVTTSIMVTSTESLNNMVDALLVAVRQNPCLVAVHFRGGFSLDTAALDEVLQRNRQRVIGRHTTEIIYEHDPEGFRIQSFRMGKKHCHEDEMKCLIYFDSPPRLSSTCLCLQVIIKLNLRTTSADTTNHPFDLTLNGHRLSLKLAQILQGKHFYSIEVAKDTMHSPVRNELVVTANREYGSDAFYLMDVIIHDDDGFEWNVNLALDGESAGGVDLQDGYDFPVSLVNNSENIAAKKIESRSGQVSKFGVLHGFDQLMAVLSEELRAMRLAGGRNTTTAATNVENRNASSERDENSKLENLRTVYNNIKINQ